MKTKTKLLLAIGLLAALCIGFLIGISVDIPKLNSSYLAGTFGKAEKFHKVQMTSKDIQLRSELTKDTAQLRSMIQGIIYFSIFTEDVCKEIDLTLTSFKAKGLGSQTGESEAAKALQDYSDFIRNNNKTLGSTITLLTGFYMKDTVNLIQDVEKNLKDFGSYVNGLNQKNDVLVQALKSIDSFMAANKALQANTKEIDQLKSIRDKLLIKGLQMGAIMNNKQLVGQMVVLAIGSNSPLTGTLTGNANLYGNIGGKSGIDATLNAGLNCLVYNSSLQSFSLNNTLAQSIANGLQQAVIVFGKGDISVNLNNYDIQNVYSSQVVGSVPLNCINQVFIGGSAQNAFSISSNVSSFYNSMGSNYGIVLSHEN
jgi:hypothetical protein